MKRRKKKKLHTFFFSPFAAKLFLSTRKLRIQPSAFGRWRAFPAAPRPRASCCCLWRCSLRLQPR